MNTDLLPLTVLAAPPLYALAAAAARRARARCPVDIPAPADRPVPCTKRPRHEGRHLNRPTGRTWPNPTGGT
ncbi:hypothetical protein HTV80_12960 [Streptomyces sp. Vc74B-19]|uniref:hypothetical protein n=1 Tax=Streptomyces sp. Vc74B-19 TaxID=2741324 RepID=UPI001BFC9D06|nr:hypothetical protein [Streptomyces sp. Vc74B-19]MBT3164020.1 hypothetical protein [Streptomyces sp. Vc74B-19]